MKITSVELHPEGSSQVVVLSFRDPRGLNPYNINGISGLDAPEIVPRYYGTSEASGAKFYNLALPKRTPVFRIGLSPDFGASETYSDLRDDLYRMISSSRTGRIGIQFKNGTTVVAQVSGFISKFENSLFEKKPAVQITFEAVDAMLVSPTLVNVPVAGLDTALTIITDNLSTAPHGFSFVGTFSGAADYFYIGDEDVANWIFRVSPVSAGGFLTGDELHFSSDQNNKELYIVRDGDPIYIADAIGMDSVWPILFPGENRFTVAQPTPVSGLFSWTSISYYPTYWGV